MIMKTQEECRSAALRNLERKQTSQSPHSSRSELLDANVVLISEVCVNNFRNYFIFKVYVFFKIMKY